MIETKEDVLEFRKQDARHDEFQSEEKYYRVLQEE